MSNDVNDPARPDAVSTGTGRKRTRSETVLFLVGGIGVVIGGIVALVANSQAHQARLAAEYGGTLGGARGASSAVASAWMWSGLAVAVLAALLLIAVMVVRGARSRGA
ncbi:MAG TPA: hypothetical protein VGC18_05975 [Lacisediminihabitans sp.]|uniref:hypothetical protein n=1 Tax=Lacisediminihabitans sp. TaxID=2787631 RepID=UPI002ED79E6E